MSFHVDTKQISILKILKIVTSIPGKARNLIQSINDEVAKFTWRKWLGICTISFVILICACNYVVNFCVCKKIITWNIEERYNFIKAVILLALIIFWIALIKFNISIFDKLISSLKGYISVDCATFDINKDNHYMYVNSRKSLRFILPLGILQYVFFNKSNIKFPFLCIMILICSVFFCITMFAKKENKCIWICAVVMACGMTYLTYVVNYTNIDMITNIIRNLVVGKLYCFAFIACVIVFYIAGSAICTMIEMVKFLFFTNLENKLETTKTQCKQFIYDIKNIRRFFIWMTIVNVYAFVHLYGIVYFFGLTGDNVTKILFGVGSAFPLLMFSATTFLYNDLLNKINIKCNYEISQGFKFDFSNMITLVTSLVPLLTNLLNLQN